MARTSVNNINYVDFAKVNSIQMKQGDKTPIAIKLQQVSASIRRNSNLSEQETMATIYLSDSKEKKVIYKGDFEVKLGTVTLIIDSILPAGVYSLEIDYDGKKFPSDNSFSLMINPSATVAPEEIKSLDTIETIQENILIAVSSRIEKLVEDKLSDEVANYVNANKDILKGDKGDKMTFSDLTTAEKELLKGDKGDKGDKWQFSDLSNDEKEELKGDKGDKGDSVIATPKIYTRDEYNKLETKDSNTLYFISEG